MAFAVGHGINYRTIKYSSFKYEFVISIIVGSCILDANIIISAVCIDGWTQFCRGRSDCLFRNAITGGDEFTVELGSCAEQLKSEDIHRSSERLGIYFANGIFLDHV